MKQIENRMGCLLVLENPRARVVGAAVVKRLETYYEQHVAMMSFCVAPAYFDQTRELLDRAAARAAQIGIEQLALPLSARDDSQIELATAAGFGDPIRWPNRFCDGGDRVDMLILRRDLPGPGDPAKERSVYYAERQPWQSKRVAEEDNRA